MAHNTRDPWLDIYNSQCTIGGSATNSHDLTDLQLVVENQDGKNHTKKRFILSNKLQLFVICIIYSFSNVCFLFQYLIVDWIS